MNICFIAKTILPTKTAESIFAMKMCQAYASLGHRVTLVLPNWPGSLEPGVEDVYAFYGVRQEFAIRRASLPHWKSFSSLDHTVLMPALSLRARPDFIHSRSLSAAWGLTHLFRRPTVLEIHSPPRQNTRLRSLFRRTAANPHLKALVLITHALAAHVRPLLPEATRLIVAPDGVDASWVRQAVSPMEARRRLGLQDEGRRLAVYTGHLYQGRGIELIIEIARHLPDHLFLIVGGREADVVHYRQQAGAAPNLLFTGFKPPAEMLLYLQAADALLMPYANRVATSGGGDTAAFASPMKMFEYMAAGRPILASTLPVLKEVLQDGVNALLLPYDQPQRWIDALRHLRQDSQSAEALGRRARLDVEQYTWESRAQRLLDQIG